ncbi:MAG: MASE1 domain-containing protein [Planctomycetes bacterium]|nr:MASE1 domain-containing protein [Planctomycetota bacterium]
MSPAAGSLLRLAGFFGCHLAACALGLAFARVGPYVSPVWPATGVALAGLLLGGVRLWPAVAAGTVLSSAWYGIPWMVALVFAVANSAEAVVAARLLARMGFANRFRTLRDLYSYGLAACVAGPLVSMGLGVLGLHLAGALTGPGIGTAVRVWLLGNVLGAMIVGPVLLEWARPPGRATVPRRLEAVGSVLLLLVLCGVTFFDLGHDRNLPLSYLPILVVAWIALRFRAPGSTLATVVVAIAAVWGTTQARGPFGSLPTSDVLVLQHTFLLVVASTSLLFAVIADERETALELSRANEARYAVLFEQAPDGIVVMGVDGEDRGRLLAANAAAARMHGYETRDLLRMNIADLDAPEEALHVGERLARTLGSGGMHEIIEHRHRDGHLFPVEANGRVLRIGAQRFVLAFLRDVSDRREAEARQQVLDRRLQEVQKIESLGVLAGGVAHDFNNLLTGILGSATLARADLAPDHPARTSVDQIVSAAHRAADLCRQMLAYSGKGRFQVQRLDLSALIEASRDLLVLTAGHRPAVRVELTRNLPAVEADPTQIRQVVMNLLHNSADALGERPGTIHLRTGAETLRAEDLHELVLGAERPPGPYVWFEVEDDGPGIQEDVLPRIFEPFFTTKFTGRGLGLAAALGIVRGHRGAIRVRSNEGRGATIRIYLPAVATPAEPVPEPPRPADGNGWRGEGTILIVDDEDAVRVVLARMARALGLQTLEARGGEEALTCYAARPRAIRAVLLDLTMPGLPGEETLRRLKELDPAAKVVLMSGYSQQEALERCTGLGPAGFLQKPFTLEDVRERLRAALG